MNSMPYWIIPLSSVLSNGTSMNSMPYWIIPLSSVLYLMESNSIYFILKGIPLNSNLMLPWKDPHPMGYNCYGMIYSVWFQYWKSKKTLIKNRI
jgi:hypothetical protein